MKPYYITSVIFLICIILAMYGQALHIPDIPSYLKLTLWLVIASAQIWSVFWGIIGYFSRKPKIDYLITFILGIIALPFALLLPLYAYGYL